jgi:hypothetical protein
LDPHQKAMGLLIFFALTNEKKRNDIAYTCGLMVYFIHMVEEKK